MINKADKLSPKLNIDVRDVRLNIKEMYRYVSFAFNHIIKSYMLRIRGNKILRIIEKV